MTILVRQKRVYAQWTLGVAYDFEGAFLSGRPILIGRIWVAVRVYACEFALAGFSQFAHD